MSDENIIRIECIIRGRVQLVMFRDFVKRNARKLNIVGYVKNLSDGSVEVVAEGRAQDIESLMSHLQKGSILANVEGVEVHNRKPRGDFKNFNIDYGN